MSDRITIDIIIKNNNITSKSVKEWFELVSYFNPTDMTCRKLTKGKFQKFNLEKFQKNIDEELNYEDSNNIMIKDSQNSVSIRKGSINQGISSFSCVLGYDIFEENKGYILEVIDKYMIEYEGIVAYACSLEDWFWQNNEDIQMYELKGKSMEGVKTKKSDIFPDDDEVDIEYNPGHSHVANGVWFGSCWMMWYGREYFRHIPMEVLTNFKNCYENKLYLNDFIRITLYESPWDYDKKENRDRQWEFRKTTGVDELASILEKDDINNTNIDASIEISEGVFEHGGIRLIKYYYDSEGELIVKSQAIEVKIYELGEKGELLWSKSEKINQ